LGTDFNNKYFYFVLLSLFLIGIGITPSCSNSEKQKFVPETMLSEEEMISIMTDLHLVEAALSLRRNRGQSTNDVKDLWFAQLFEQHKTTATIFEENLSFYNEQPEKMEKILEEVMANLSQMQSELNAGTLDSVKETN
jgi:hypothetical protein